MRQLTHLLPPILLVPWVNEIWNARRPIGTAKLVLIAIAWATELDGKAKIAVLELCKQTGLSESTVARQIRLLERNGLLWVEHHKGSEGNTFQVLIGNPLAYLETLREHAHTVSTNPIDLRIKDREVRSGRLKDREVRSGRLHPDERQGSNSTLSDNSP